jgi:SanA protein
MRRVLKRVSFIAAGCGVTTVVLLGGLRLWVEQKYRDRIYTCAEDVPPRFVAIVPGAGLWPDGSLTPVLADRVATAADLYHAGTVQKLLCSGDNRFVDYNEPQRMLEYAVSLGVPEEAIVLDYAGRRTYDTCYRAREVFGLDSAVLVTQQFHLPRALFTCHRLGLEVVGVAADQQRYSPRSLAWSRLREIPALLVALVDVLRQAPPRVSGDPIALD